MSAADDVAGRRPAASGKTHPRRSRPPGVTETLRAEVVHVVPPDELDDVDLQPELRDLADDRYVVVCRKGGSPSWVERLVAFLRRRPIEAVTVVTDRDYAEGAEFTTTVEATDIAGVYEAVATDA